MISALVLALVHADSVRVSPDGAVWMEPQLAARREQVYVVSGTASSMFSVASFDDGLTFRSPVAISVPGKLAIGMRRGPRIVLTPFMTSISAVVGGDLLSWRLAGDGKKWNGPFKVSDQPGAAREGLHAMGASVDGSVLACAWLDLRASGTEIWTSVSRDGGETWSKNVCAYRSPDGHVCECCHPSVAFDAEGKLYVMFRNWLGGARDMYVVTSANEGQSFGLAKKLGLGTWPLNACPMDGGGVAVEKDGTVETAWRREGKVYFSSPGKPEKELGEGTQPWITCALNGPTVVWQNQGKLQAWSFEGRLTDFAEGGDPVAAVSSLGRIAAWADDNGQVWVRRLTFGENGT